jgi:hypothetical protein
MTKLYYEDRIPLDHPDLPNRVILVRTHKTVNGYLATSVSSILETEDGFTSFPLTDYLKHVIVDRTIKRITAKAARLQHEQGLKLADPKEVVNYYTKP